MKARNPILRLPSAHRLIEELDPSARRALREILWELGAEADRLAQESWRKRKGPMACYWRACSVYARHIGRALNTVRHRPEVSR